MTLTEAAAVTVESDIIAPTAKDQTAPLPPEGMLSWSYIDLSESHSACPGFPWAPATRTLPFGAETFDRSIFAVVRAVEFMTVTAAPMLVERVPLPSRFKTKPPDAVIRSIAAVARTETSPSSGAIVTELSVIVASTNGSIVTTATNPETLEPDLLPFEKTASAVPPVETTDPPAEKVFTAE